MISRIRWAVAAILATLTVGTVSIHWAYHTSWAKSGYMVLAIMSTVSDSSIHPVSNLQLLITALVIVVGTVLWIFSLSLVVSFFLEMDMGVFRERRFLMEMRKWDNHFVVIGAGRVGESIARELLDMGERVVLVDKDPKQVERVRTTGLKAFVLQNFQAEAFGSVNLPEAAGIALALPDDAENLYAFLTAQAINPDLKVVARASSGEAAQYLRDLGIDRVILPDVVGGRRLARMLVKPVAHDLLMALLNEEGVHVDEEAVTEDSPIAHQPVQKVREIFGGEVTLIGYWRAKELHMAPKASERILPEDTLILVRSNSDG